MHQRSSISSHFINDIVYAVPLSHPEKCSGETPIYRHPETLQRLPTTINRVPHLTTLQALHDYAFQEYANLDCLGTRVRKPDGSLGHFQFKSYNTINKTAQQVGSAILNMGLAPVISVKENPDCRFIVIYAANSEEWLTLDIAASLYGLTVVPIFANLGVESLQYIFEHTSASTIFSSKANLDRLVKDSSEGKIVNLKNIVCFEGYTQQQKTFAHKANVQLLSWNELLSFGQNNVLPYPVVTPDTVFTIQYTSGTTGNPKGAILTHGNFIAAYAGSENKLGYDLQAINKGDVHLSYLPLAHIFERFFAHLVLFRGCTIGIFSGDVQKLTDDLQALKPTFMISVPRLFKRFYDILQAILHKVAPMTDPHNDPIDPKVLKQLRNVTGGRVKAYYSGSAPLDPNIAKFLKKAFSAPIIETFGQTEISGGGFSQRVEDDTFGHIGGNLSGLEFKLVDVPDMEYTSKDKASNGEPMPRGELCLRGAQIFKGYYKEAEKTAETIDEYGWHHTGDIGMILPNGAVKLIDRRKNIFKLSQGEFIAPEKIENVYLNNRYVAEAFIYGDPLKSYTVGIIVPDRENLTDIAKKLGIENICYEELCKDADITAYMLQETKNTGRRANLAGYEIAQAIYLESNPLSAQGLMTFTMKLKRDIAKKQYNQIIHELYEKEEILKNSRL